MSSERADHGSTTADRFVILAGLVSVVALVWQHMAILGDGFWYIATGRELLRARALPTADPFCFATVRDAWTIVSAGSDVLFALVADHLGLRALMMLATFVESLAVGLLWLAASSRTTTRLVLLPIALLFVAVDAEDLSARGQIFGDLAFVVLLSLLGRLRAARRVPRLVPLALGAVWVNLHLSFQLGIAIPLAFAAALALEPSEERPPLRPFAQFFGLFLLGSAANPYGPGYLIYAVKCALAPAVGLFDLFRSPDLHAVSWLIAPGLAIALVIARVSCGPARGSRTDAALLLAFLAGACASRRYVSELLALELLVAAPLVDRIDWSRRLRRLVAIEYGLGALLLGASALAFREPKDPLHDVPAAATNVITEQHLPQNILNPYHWGGYLAYAWRGQPRYFVDGRDIFGLVGNGILDDVVRLRSEPASFERILDAYEIKTVLWESDELLDGYLAENPAWQRVYKDPVAVVYTRRK